MSAAPLALTMGDPAGIGLEVALQAWREGAGLAAPFFLIADPAAVERIDRTLGWATPVEITTPAGAAGVFGHALPIVPMTARADAAPGQPNPATAPAILESISRAVGYVHAGEAAAVVTNPIAKKTLYDAGFKHPGHTEYLGELSAAGARPPCR